MKPRHWINIAVSLVAAGLLASALLLLLRVTKQEGELVFFRVTEDKGMYSKDPAKYDRVVFPPRAGGSEVYVERSPALRIYSGEIDSVVIERQKDVQETLEEIFGIKSPGSEGGQKTDANESVPYQVTFFLNEAGSTKLNKFLREHDGEWIDVKMNNQRLSTPRIIGPFGSRQFSLGLAGKPADRLKEMFSPIKEKVIWK